MKFRKNLEGVFVVAAALATVASYATANVRAIEMPATSYAAAAVADSKMHVVVVKAPRLTAAEKAAQN